MMILIFSVSATYAQSAFQGTVTDANGETLIGVNVVVEGTTIGSVTDMNGEFMISSDMSKATLVVSFIGYLTQKIEATAGQNVQVQLQEDVLGIDEVVIVGYGVQKKSLVTGAISNVKADDIATMPSARVDQAIQGRTAGVAVLPTSGSPGSGTKIRIRGTNSNGNSNPLFIVDGMKTGDIDNIDPANIESVELLKDAASAAIYGTEGANGVILITTKSGKQNKNGKGSVSYNFQYGIQQVRTKMELMNASEYEEWMKAADSENVVNGSADTDWIDETFESAPMMKHNLSFGGATGSSSYLLALSYYTQDGVAGGENAKYDRFNFRVNGKKSINKYLEVGNNLSYSHSKKKYIGEDDEYRGIVNNVLLIDPLTPVVYDSKPQKVTDLENEGKVILQDENGKYYGLAENVGGETVNPVAKIQTYHNDIVTDKVLGMAYAKIMPFRGFSFTSRFGIDMSYQTQHAWNPVYYFSSENTNSIATVDDDIDRWYTWLWENFATYNYEANGHNVMALLGYSAEEYRHNTYSLHSGPMVKEADEYAYHDHVLGRDLDKVGGDFTNNTMTSIFGRVSYNFLDRYIVEASVRRDAASVFPEDDKSAVFPAISAGWVISEEDWANFGFVNYLKLRGSWGQNGSKGNLPGNEDKEFWLFSGIRFPNANDEYYSGAEIDKLINKNLVWETTEQLDIGFDVRAFDGRFNFSMDYYNKKTKDLLVQGRGPLSVGNEYPFVNGGDVTNKGFDFEIGYRNNDNPFKYSINLNLSTQDNEVTNLAIDAPVPGDNLRGYDLTWFEEGYPIWYFRGYKTNGVDSKGEVIVEDVSGDGEISPNDLTYIGDPHADLLFGGNINLSYMGFDLGIFLQGSYGNDIFMGWHRTDRKYSNKPKYMYDGWKDGSLPDPNNTSDFIYRSDLMIQDGSYLRIKQLQLGYSLPKEILKPVGISRLKAYVSLDDYFTFTGYEGLDPEAGSSEDDRQGIDRGVYPIPGKILFGLSLSF